jgi:hypothetical protein
MLLKFPFAPIDRNNSHIITTRGKHARLIKTSKCRQFEDQMLGWLFRYEKDKNAFLGQYEANKHAINLKMIYRTPRLYTKKGTINKRSIDCDAFKVPQDILMQWLKIDDSQILNFQVIKSFSREPSFEYEIGLYGYVPEREILKAFGDL